MKFTIGAGIAGAGMTIFALYAVRKMGMASIFQNFDFGGL